MNYLGTHPSFDHAYHSITEAIWERGVRATPRGFACRELRPASFTLARGDRSLYTHRSRKLNYRFFAAEAVSYIAGWGEKPEHADLLCLVNSQMTKFRNPDTGLFDGAYGPRLFQSLSDISTLLQRDPSTRQAVASIWSPGLPGSSLDIPCTLNLHFFTNPRMEKRRAPIAIKQETGEFTHTADVPEDELELDLHVTMRSNDSNLGLPYDVPAFCAIQAMMAASCGLQQGAYHHSAGSLHTYEENAHHAKAPWDDVTGCIFPSQIPTPPLGATVQLVQLEANQWLTELLAHRQAGGAWTDFVSSLELPSRFLSLYWQFWGLLVRFSWKSIR